MMTKNSPNEAANGCNWVNIIHQRPSDHFVRNTKEEIAALNCKYMYICKKEKPEGCEVIVENWINHP